MTDPIEQISDILGAPKGWLDRRAEVTREAALENYLGSAMWHNPEAAAEAFNAIWDSARASEALHDDCDYHEGFEEGFKAAKVEITKAILQAVLNDVHPAALGDGYAHFLASVRRVGEQFGVSDL